MFFAKGLIPPGESDPQIWIGKDMAAFATSYFGTGE